ncbi:sensor histidine kinase [Amycolatopsis thermoflava]|uniref:sensor histidine kinase n=1 Tax=Amycolatopsis thermoflava TaxID=84480 RepID=UPI00364A8591
MSERKRVLADAALGVATSTVVAVAIAMDLGGARAPDPVAYLFAVCLGALMLVRRRFPVLALAATAAGLLAYHAAGYPPVGLALPVAAALFSAAEAGRARVAAVTAAGLVLVSTFFRLRQGEDPDYLLGFELASTVGLMLSAIALGALRAEQRRTARQAAVEREWEARRRVEEERLRIARDLHDAVGHTLAVVSVQASVAAEALDDDPDAARSALATLRLAADEAVHDLRTTLGLLTDDTDRAPAGSLRHLDALVTATVRSGLEVTVSTEGEPVALPAAVDTTAYRIVQEALTNSLRHARASKAEVRLRYEPGRLRIQVCDDGAGAELPARGGRGLDGMRDRAELLGGSVTLESRLGAGFRIDASLPVEPR